MRVYQGGAIEGSKTPLATAAAELAARADDVVQEFTTRLAAPVEPTALETLRSIIVELARAHAARTVLETITARDARRAAKRQRRSWARRSQAQP